MPRGALPGEEPGPGKPSCSASGCLGLGGGKKEGSVQRPELRPDLWGRRHAPAFAPTFSFVRVPRLFCSPHRVGRAPQ